MFEKTEISSSVKFVKHESKSMKQLKVLKKILQKKITGPTSTESDRKEYWKVLRAISDLRKQEKKKEMLKTTAHQENLFNKNRWEFSKHTVRGDLGK